MLNLFFIILCAFSTEATAQALHVRLQAVPYVDSYQERVRILPFSTSMQRDLEGLKRLPNGYANQEVSYFEVQPALGAFQQYQKGLISEAVFQSLISQEPLDLQPHLSQFLDQQIAIATKTNAQGGISLIVDANNDEDLSNDPLIDFPAYHTAQRTDFLKNLAPQAIQFQFLEGGSLRNGKAFMRFMPYNQQNRPLPGRLYAALAQFWVGRFEAEGFKHLLFVQKRDNSPLCEAGSRRFTDVMILPDNGQPLETQQPFGRTFKVGAETLIGLNTYQIEALSTDCQTLTLRFARTGTKVQGVEEHEYLPPLEAPNLNHQTIKIPSPLNRYLVLDFWGTWCGPCIQEMPYLHDLSRAYPSDTVQFYGVVVNDAPENARQFMHIRNYAWEQLLDAAPDGLAYQLNVAGLPNMFAIAPDGQVIKRSTRAMDILERLWQDPKLRNTFQSYLQAGNAVFEWNQKAHEVMVEGSFNEGIRLPLYDLDRTGQWQRRFPVKRGRYTYRYLVNGSPITQYPNHTAKTRINGQEWLVLNVQ